MDQQDEQQEKLSEYTIQCYGDLGNFEMTIAATSEQQARKQLKQFLLLCKELKIVKFEGLNYETPEGVTLN